MTGLFGEMRTDLQYYHRLVAVTLVSTPFPIPLGIRFHKDGEAEVPCALALLQDLVGQLGRRFLNILVGDAIYLQAPFVKEVECLGLDWVFTLKTDCGMVVGTLRNRCPRTQGLTQQTQQKGVDAVREI